MYLIKTYFDVYEDDYNEGEGKHVTQWDWESKHDAIESALQQHFEQVGLSYDDEHMHEDMDTVLMNLSIDLDHEMSEEEILMAIKDL